LYPNPEVLRQPFVEEKLFISVYNHTEQQQLNMAINRGIIQQHQFLILSKAFRDCAKRCIGLPKRHTSTGILAVVLAASICGRIAVFGKSLQMDSFDLNRFKYHYFEENQAGDEIDNYFSSFHNPQLEDTFYKRMASVGVTFIP